MTTTSSTNKLASSNNLTTPDASDTTNLLMQQVNSTPAQRTKSVSDQLTSVSDDLTSVGSQMSMLTNSLSLLSGQLDAINGQLAGLQPPTQKAGQSDKDFQKELKDWNTKNQGTVQQLLGQKSLIESAISTTKTSLDDLQKRKDQLTSTQAQLKNVQLPQAQAADAAQQAKSAQDQSQAAEAADSAHNKVQPDDGSSPKDLDQKKYSALTYVPVNQWMGNPEELNGEPGTTGRDAAKKSDAEGVKDTSGTADTASASRPNRQRDAV